MTEPVDQLEQVAQELLNEAEKETDPVKRERLLYLAQEYRSRAEQARRGLVVESSRDTAEATGLRKSKCLALFVCG